MEWLLLCLREDDGEEKIKHEVQLCVCSRLRASDLIVFKAYLSRLFLVMSILFMSRCTYFCLYS